MTKSRLLIACVLGIGLSAYLLQAAEIPTVSVDTKAIITKAFLGLGVQWDPYEYPPSAKDWRLTLHRLDRMQPAFFRVMWRADAYCFGYDKAGQPQYIWQTGDTAARKRLEPLFKILDYAQRRHIDVMLGEWAWPHKLTTGPDDPRWAQMIADFVRYLTATRKYSVIRYYNFMNEPNGTWMWPGRTVNYEAWAAGMRNLRMAFDRYGLQWLPIAGPDNSGNWDWVDRSAHDLSTQIGFWEMHWYVKDKELFDDSVEKLLAEKRDLILHEDPNGSAKGLYMGESGIIDGRVNGDQQPRVKDFVYGVLMADYVAQVARAGWMGASAWDLDDAMHAVDPRKTPVPPNDLTLKIWGFWNTQGRAMGHPEDEAIRPWFYTWSLMTRLLPKGAAILQTNTTTELPGFRTVAAQTRDGINVMLVNDSDTPRSVRLQIPEAQCSSAIVYDYFEKKHPVNADGYPVPSEIRKSADLARGILVNLPSRGVTFVSLPGNQLQNHRKTWAEPAGF